jgi:hypothetical protein
VRESLPVTTLPSRSPLEMLVDWVEAVVTLDMVGGQSLTHMLRTAELPRPRTLHGDERCNCEQDNCGAIDIRSDG